MLDEIETPCPVCGGRLKFSLNDVASQRTVRCSRGHSVKLEDEDGGARKAAKSLRDLDQSLKKLGRMKF